MFPERLHQNMGHGDFYLKYKFASPELISLHTPNSMELTTVCVTSVSVKWKWSQIKIERKHHSFLYYSAMEILSEVSQYYCISCYSFFLSASTLHSHSVFFSATFWLFFFFFLECWQLNFFLLIPFVLCKLEPLDICRHLFNTQKNF